MQIKERIVKLGQEQHTRVVQDRKHLHMHPELSFEEKETSKYICNTLDSIGVPYTTGWAGYGVVATIEGNKPDAGMLALRADMDALPIRETNDVPYKSQNDGVMHACGHDVHTSSLLGVARILHAVRDSFNGTVRLIFQPGEEQLPGGASIMIKEGVLENPRPGAIIGQHVYPLLPAGHVGFRPGRFMASADEINLTVHGRGGHGALPHFTIDPIAITSQIVTALQQVVSRASDPTMPSVLTFGKIESEGGSFNVIPGAVHMMGTFRTFDETWRKQAHEKIRAIATGIAEGFGATCDVDITVGYPFLVNEPELTGLCHTAAQELLGAEHVHDLPIRMTAEDFAYYTHQVPGCFYRLGVANAEKGINSPVHTPTFDADEQSLLTGPTLMSWLAITRLAHS